MPEAIVFPYTAVQLTGTINKIPNIYGLLNELNVFPARGIRTTLVEVRRENGTLAVLPATDRGAPPSVAKRQPGDALYFEVPHIPHMDRIDPLDLQNMLRVVAETASFKTLDEEMAQRMIAIRNKHAITLEWLRMGALKGLITDGNGAPIYDLFASFNIARPVIYFDLSNNSADIDGACDLLFRTIATALRGEVMSGIEVLCSTSFFSAFVAHPKVQKFWLNWQNAEKLANIERVSAGGQMGRTFDYQRIRWREYYGVAPIVVAGVPTSAPFVEDTLGFARPLGTLDTFVTYFAPANDIRYVNQMGQEVYVSPKILDHGEGVELKSESDPLPICRRPELLVTVSSAAPNTALPTIL